MIDNKLTPGMNFFWGVGGGGLAIEEFRTLESLQA